MEATWQGGGSIALDRRILLILRTHNIDEMDNANNSVCPDRMEEVLHCCHTASHDRHMLHQISDGFKVGVTIEEDDHLTDLHQSTDHMRAKKAHSPMITIDIEPLLSVSRLGKGQPTTT